MSNQVHFHLAQLALGGHRDTLRLQETLAGHPRGRDTGRIRIGLPFALRPVDVDNGSDFVNNRLIEYCLGHGIELTRSRPYRTNDQAWIEQKNGAVVRKLLGYRRFEGLAAARAITQAAPIVVREGTPSRVTF
ncbi:hypothetical protein [Mesorhizobium sp. M0563]|uniref:hypothetical protein n=1 Tax=Mesorhizobium sp. M0563 TaxID=2956959 RepID=UPI0033358A84